MANLSRLSDAQWKAIPAPWRGRRLGDRYRRSAFWPVSSARGSGHGSGALVSRRGGCPGPLKPRRPGRTVGGTPFQGSIAQLGGDNDAGADRGVADSGHACGDDALRVADQIGNNVGVQEISRHNARGVGWGSAISGNSSSIGANVARSARSDLGVASSMISVAPSFRMIASEPGSAKARGIRTAWLRPFLNSRTRCSTVIDDAPAWALSKAVSGRALSAKARAWGHAMATGSWPFDLTFKPGRPRWRHPPPPRPASPSNAVEPAAAAAGSARRR